MPAQRILTFPHPLLKKRAHRIDRVDKSISALIEDLIDTMRAGPGSVGVADPAAGMAGITTMDCLPCLIQRSFLQAATRSCVKGA